MLHLGRRRSSEVNGTGGHQLVSAAGLNLLVEMEHRLWILLAALFSGLVAGDRISPAGDEVIQREGEPVSLRCDYDTTSNYVYLYWYKHHSDLQAPHFILWKGERDITSEYIPDKRYECQTSRESSVLTITRLSLTDTALYYCALEGGPGFRLFGKGIRLTVTPRDPVNVAPTLFVLSPLGPSGRESTLTDPPVPEVCLASGFYSKGRDLVLNWGGLRLTTTNAVLSPERKTYFYAGFSDQRNQSCELLGTESRNQSVQTEEPGSQTEEPGSQTEEPGSQTEEPGPRTELNWYLLLLNAVRLIFIKAVAFSSLLTIRAVLFGR